ncbi:MAG: hypothetical protein ACTSX8_01645 [Alphaproteobacteria bacterium]
MDVWVLIETHVHEEYTEESVYGVYESEEDARDAGEHLPSGGRYAGWSVSESRLYTKQAVRG